jgi:hypothetical protein
VSCEARAVRPIFRVHDTPDTWERRWYCGEHKRWLVERKHIGSSRALRLFDQDVRSRACDGEARSVAEAQAAVPS